MIAFLLRALVSRAHGARQSRRSAVASARVSLSRFGSFLLRLLGGNDRQAFAGFGEFDGRVLLSQLPHREVERVADVDGERTILRLLLRPDECGLGHAGSLLTFNVGAGGTEILGRPTRVTTAENQLSVPPAGGRIGRPIGAKISAVPGFTARRMELGFSTTTIARKITDHGIPTTPQAVSAWESQSQRFRPLENRIDALAEILFVDRVVVERWFGVEFVSGGSHAQ